MTSEREIANLRDKSDGLLSVILIPANDERKVSEALGALAKQQGAPSMEIIVPFFPALVDGKTLSRGWPSVRFVEMPDSPPPATPEFEHRKVDRLRSHSLLQARGEVIAMLQDDAVPGPVWCASIWAEHQARADAVIGGGIVYAGERLLDRASFYCDFGRYQPPFPETRGGYASVLNVSWKREALSACRDAWEKFFDENVVHRRILSDGRSLVLTPSFTVLYQPERLPFSMVLRRKIGSGRSFAGRRAQSLSAFRRVIFALLAPALAPLMLFRQFALLQKRGHSAGRWLAASPLVTVLLLCWSLGELKGYVSAKPFADPSQESL